MSAVEVHVALDGRDVLAGVLYPHRRRGSESATFSYDTAYLARTDAYAIDPALPLRGGAFQTRVGQRIFGALSDCAPDRWGRTLLLRREAVQARSEARATRSFGEVDFLLGARDDLRQGALRFRIGAGPFLAQPEVGVPALTDLPALLDLTGRAESDTADLADLRRLVHAGSSLGGARPKAHVRDSDGRVGIAKFPSARHDTWNVMAWEKVLLDLAGAAGIDVPESRLLSLAGRRVLLLHRFDRSPDGDRIGYVSAMTMLEAADGERRSYPEIADAIEVTSRRATEDLHQLWRRIVFFILVSNTDDHLRNHGFLHDRGEAWRLAPAFDLNPDPTPGAKFLSTAADEGDDSASLALAMHVSRRFRLAPEQARHVLRKVATAVDRWRDVAAHHGLSPSEIDAMEPAFMALGDPLRT